MNKENKGFTLLQTPKAIAQWSLDKDFGVVFSSPRKKPNLIARTLQRWLLGIHWRDIKGEQE
jgi:hypothetical protein